MTVDADQVYSVKFDVTEALRALDSVSEHLAKIETEVKRVAVAAKPIGDSFRAAFAQMNKGPAGEIRTPKIQTGDSVAAVEGVSNAVRRMAASGDYARKHMEESATSIQKALAEASRRIAGASGVVKKEFAEQSAGARKVAAAGAELDRLMSAANKRRAASEREATSAINATERAIRKTNEAAQGKGVKTLEDRLKGIGVGAGLANQSLTSLFLRIQALMGLSGEIRDVVGDYLQFDKAAVGASIRFGEAQAVGTEGFRTMRSEIRGMATDAGVSSAEAAKSVEAWSKAGLGWDQARAVLPVTLEAAVSMDLPDVGKAGDLLSDALGQFNMRSDDVETLRKNIARVSDVVVKAADISTLDPAQIFESYKAAAPMVTAMGESIEQLSADLVALGNAGIKGGEAGTVIKGIYAGLTAARGPARKIMEDLKIEVNDSQGNFRGLTKILSDFATKTASMGSGERTGLLTKIVGRENIAGFLNLMRTGSAELDNMTRALENAGGTSAEVAEKMRASVSKQFDIFKQKAVDVGFKILEDTDFFGRLNKKLDEVDFDRVSEVVSDTVIPALETLGNVITNVLWPAFQNVSSVIKAVAGPVLSLAGWALDGVSEKGNTAATVLTALGLLWAAYKVKVMAAKAVDVVGYFASMVKGATAAATAQGALNASIQGTTGALNQASKAASALNGIFGVLSAAVAGWAIGEVIYREIVDPMMVAIDQVAKLKAAVEDSREKDKKVFEGGKEKAIPVLESDLKDREKLLEEEKRVSEKQKFEAASRGIFLGDEKSESVKQLEAEIANLKNRIATEKQKKQIAAVDVTGDESAYQTQDLGPSLVVTEYEEDWSPGSLDVTPPPRPRAPVRVDEDQTSDMMAPELALEQSVPTAYEIPPALFRGTSRAIYEEDLFDLPVSRDAADQAAYVQAGGAPLPGVADSIKATNEAIAALAATQKQTLEEGMKQRAGAVTVTQKIDIGGTEITIQGSNLTEAQLGRAIRSELKEHNRRIRDDLANAAKSVSPGEF